MKNLKTISTATLTAALAGTLFAGQIGLASAYENSGQYYEATVVESTPVYRTVKVNNPVQQCWEEAVAAPKSNYTGYTPEILGAIVGAGVGRFFGSGRGQDAATVAGAVLGGSIGHDQKVKRTRGNQQVRYEQRCKTVDQYTTQRELEGYDVTYEYKGDLYTTQTARDPGETITVSVSVVPVE